MSFYGNTQYNVSKSFAAAAIKTGEADSANNGYEKIDAETRVDLIGFAPGDDWIQLSKTDDKTDGTDTFDQIEFSHGDPVVQADNNKYVIVSKIDSLPNQAVVDTLEDKSYLKISSLKYDEKGHISGTQDTYLKMPERDYDKSLDTIEEDIEKLKNFDAQQTEKNKVYDGFDSRIKTAEETVLDMDTIVNDPTKGLERTYTLITNTNKALGNLSNVSSKDLASTLGNFDQLKSTNESLKNFENFTSLIQAAYNEAQSASGNAGAANRGINELMKKIGSLEGLNIGSNENQYEDLTALLIYMSQEIVNLNNKIGELNEILDSINGEVI